MPVTRFAPSPTGYLHLGHAYSALFAAQAAQGGEFILRIEDIDPTRCKDEYTQSIFEDLAWLGLSWPQPVRYQSRHLPDYAAALDVLREQNLIYPCFCTRKDIEREVKNSGRAPHVDDGTPIYPGTCRNLGAAQREERMARNNAVAWRLHVARAMEQTGPLVWHDRHKGTIQARPDMFGDVVLARKDAGVSYHLCVTLDDHVQKIDLVTRGEDLFSCTHIHRLLQAILGLNVPDYWHHALMTGNDGQRYAKRNKAATLRDLRQSGLAPHVIREKLGFA